MDKLGASSHSPAAERLTTVTRGSTGRVYKGCMTARYRLKLSRGLFVPYAKTALSTKTLRFDHLELTAVHGRITFQQHPRGPHY